MTDAGLMAAAQELHKGLAAIAWAIFMAAIIRAFFNK